MGMGISWGFPQVFLWVWDGYGEILATIDTLADCAAVEVPGHVDKQKHVQNGHVTVQRQASRGSTTGRVQPAN